MPIVTELTEIPKAQKQTKWSFLNDGRIWKFEKGEPEFRGKVSALRTAMRTHANKMNRELDFEFYEDAKDGPMPGDKPYVLARLLPTNGEQPAATGGALE